MLRIRLRRVGSKKDPVYRLVVSDSRSRPEGRFVDSLGLYDPRTEPAKVEIDVARADDWIRRGARASETVQSLLKRARMVNT